MIRNNQGFFLSGGISVKRCPSCGVTKPLNDFNKNRARKDGVQSRCAECEREAKSKKFQPKRKKVSIRTSYIVGHLTKEIIDSFSEVIADGMKEILENGKCSEINESREKGFT